MANITTILFVIDLLVSRLLIYACARDDNGKPPLARSNCDTLIYTIASVHATLSRWRAHKTATSKYTDNEYLVTIKAPPSDKLQTRKIYCIKLENFYLGTFLGFLIFKFPKVFPRGCEYLDAINFNFFQMQIF